MRKREKKKKDWEKVGDIMLRHGHEYEPHYLNILGVEPANVAGVGVRVGHPSNSPPF